MSSAQEYRVVFRGQILAGFDETEVRGKAERRLRVNAEMITRLFSGRSAVLKKGLSLGEAERYVSALREIGMDVRHEAPAAPPAPQQVTRPAAPVVHDHEDLEKTQIANPSALAAFLHDLPEMPPPAPQAPATAALESARTLVVDSAALNRYLDAAADYSGLESVMPKNIALPPRKPAGSAASAAARPAQRPELHVTAFTPTRTPQTAPQPVPAPSAARTPTPPPTQAPTRNTMASPFGAAAALSDAQEDVQAGAAPESLGIFRKALFVSTMLGLFGALAWWLI